MIKSPLSILACLLLACPLRAQLSPTDSIKEMHLPAGFSATVFAAEPDVCQPISYAIDDRGRLWVAEAYNYPKWQPEGHDRITILEDTNNDGHFDKRTVFYDKLNYVTGIELGFGGVFVLSPPNLLFIPDKNNDDKPDADPQVLLTGFGHQSPHNIVSGGVWGPDGWLYGGHGGSSDGKISIPGGKEVFYDGGVWRYHPIKKIFESVMEGTTNPWGMDFDQFGQLFISNSVTPHLYHVIFGGHVERRTASPYSTHAYGLLPPAADHLHWVGPSWDKSKGGGADQLAVGGGHAHCGLLIYEADALPAQYRNTMLMVNVHGRRINNDLPERKGSGFTAHHGPDFLTTDDTFFRGLHPKAAPDGSIYLSDWYDTGECHTLNPQRNNGRIYKITYQPEQTEKQPQPDLSKLSSIELAKLQLDTNEWFVRHARRILQERGKDELVHALLKQILTTNPDITRRLRALWALHVTDGPIDSALLDDRNEYLRAWTIQLLVERGEVKAEKLIAMAEEDPSPFVRLYLASAAQRLDAGDRWSLAEKLALHDEDANDANLPLMYWYALEPLVPADPQRALSLAGRTKIPTLRTFIARRLASK